MSQPIYLASQSPRRRQMLAWLLPSFTAGSADVDESPLPGETPQHTALRLARDKALALTETANGRLVLAADTVVELDGIALGKPGDAAEACVMLTALQGRAHTVYTAVALHTPHGDVTARYVTTRVQMRAYSDAEIHAYITTGDPLDKAGAYAIQHSLFRPVARLERCYANVVGLPLCAVRALLAEAGYPLNQDLPAPCRKHFAYRCPATDEGIEGIML